MQPHEIKPTTIANEIPKLPSMLRRATGRTES